MSIYKIRFRKISKRHQSGYVLVLVTVFLMVLAGATIQFFNRTAENTRISNNYRDNSASLILAESAMEFIYTSFTSFTSALTTQAGCTPDMSCAVQVKNSLTNPDPVMLPYAYYIANDPLSPNSLSESRPSVLQNIATGEANAVSNVTLTNSSVPQAPLRIEDLFVDANRHPMLFGIDPNTGILTRITAAPNWPSAWTQQPDPTDPGNIWNGLVPNTRAATWLEFTLNPDDSSSIDIYIQSAARVGTNFSYTQKYIGSVFAQTRLGSLPVLAESRTP